MVSVKHSIQAAADLLDSWCQSVEGMDRLDDLASLLAATFQKGGKVYCMGNGGSLADASHFAEELSGKFSVARAPLPAIAFTDASHITCVGNDFGFDEIFARLVTAFCSESDIVLLLTTSGNSRNLVKAAEAARSMGATAIALTGRGGGQLSKMVDISIDFPGDTSDRIQELQMLALHAITAEIERLMGFCS